MQNFNNRTKNMRILIISLLTTITINLSADQEVFKSCVSGERSSSDTETNSFSCIESDNLKLSAWCAKMRETNSLTKKYVSSSKFCKELGFPANPVVTPLGNSFNCNFAVPKFNTCKENIKQILQELIQF